MGEVAKSAAQAAKKPQGQAADTAVDGGSSRVQLKGKPLDEQEALLTPGRAPIVVDGPAAMAPVQMEEKPGAKAPTDFDKLMDPKALKAEDAPAAIELPKAAVDGMQEAWDGSLPGDVSQEQGGNLVRNEDGSYGWRKGKPGTSGYFTPDYGDVGADQELVGIGHTHPYSKKEGGHTGVSFSGGDISSIVWETQPLNLVQSGKTLFVLARTAEFEKRLEGLDDKGKQALGDAMEKMWDDAYAAGTDGLVKDAEAATKKTCAAYDLLYYKGEGAKLDLVDTSK